jgi:predicted  nucleic acid-binding Zn-ribbon protein
MEDVFETLRSLQDILSEKIQLERKIQEIPKMLSTQEEVLDRTRRAFTDLNQNLLKAKTAEAELIKALGDAENRRENAEKNMDNITTQREYEILDKEIREAAEKEQQFRKDLQKEQQTIAGIDEDIKKRAGLIEQQERELQDRRKGVQAEESEKNAQMAKLTKKEDALKKNLDPEVFFKFERIIRNKAGKGIVAIRGGVCQGCHMILPVQFANNVRKGEEIVFCPYCSRILFYEEAGEGEEEFFDIGEEPGGLLDSEEEEDEDYDDDDDDDEDEGRITSSNFEEG